MFKSARWRIKNNRIQAVFKLQFKATQVPPTGWELMTVTLVPVDVGKPSVKLEKAAVVDGEYQWLNPIYETVKFTQDPKNGTIGDKVYQIIVWATGSVTSRVLGEINVNFADYVDVFKPTTGTFPLQGSNNGAVLHVTIQRVQGDVDERKMVENGDIMNETIDNRGEIAKPLRRTLLSQFSKPMNEEAESAANRENDIISAKEGSFMKLNSNESMSLHDDSSIDIRKSSSFDGTSASGSENSLGQYTPKGHGIKNKSGAHQENASSRPLFSTNDTLQNSDWTLSSTLDTNNAGLTDSSGSKNTLKKQKSDLDTLAKQLIVSDLELQTLRKQVVKERRRGQDLSREISILIEERDALTKECEELKASKKIADHVENISTMLQLEAKDPWSILEEMKEELDHEKNLNATLQLQLQKKQQSNSELIFAVRDPEEMLEQTKRETSCTLKDPQEMKYKNPLSNLRNSENKQESFETASDHEDEQCRLGVLMKERDDRVVSSQEKKIRYLNSELELYKKDHEDLEMQMEQIALDYEILKQENHYISSRLEQIQLREQLWMHCECPTHSDIINDLESRVKSLEKQVEAFEDNMATITRDKVEQEQRAIQAEEELRKTRWKNANTVEKLQNEFKRLSSQLSTTLYANEELVMKTLEESRELCFENCHLKVLLDKTTEELSSLQRQHQVTCQQLLGLIDFKTKVVDRVHLELKDKREDFDHQQRSEEARQNASIEEMTVLKAEVVQLAREKGHLCRQIEQNEKLVADIERLNASTKEIERLLQESNLEKELLGKELSVLREQAKKTLEELNSLRCLKDQQEKTIKVLNSKVETITIQYTDLKHSMSCDDLEKESLRKQVCLLRGDIRKEADIIANMEKRLKENNANLTISEGTLMANIRNKSKRTFQASHGPKMIASLQGNSKPSDLNQVDGINENAQGQQKVYDGYGVFGPLTVAHSQDDSSDIKDLKNYNSSGVEINENHFAGETNT